MIIPIRLYGDPVLRQKVVNIEENSSEIKQLIEDMFETMYKAHGVGLAAPQIGKAIRLFVVDASPMERDDEDETEESEEMEVSLVPSFKKVFINAEILEESYEECKFEEGCLSIPGIREQVQRPEEIVIRYLDENFEGHTDTYDGIRARIIQHEYDHIEGVMFTDKISAFKKSLIKGKLKTISKGDTEAKYPVRPFVSKTKKH